MWQLGKLFATKRAAFATKITVSRGFVYPPRERCTDKQKFVMKIHCAVLQLIPRNQAHFLTANSERAFWILH